jgi:Cysteine rich repeat
VLRNFGDSPRYRRICADLKASWLAIGFFHGDDSPVNFLQYTSVRTLARFLLICRPREAPFNRSVDLEDEMLKTLFAVSVVTILSATSGMAQSAALKACGGDVKTLCAGIQPGEGRVRACIKSHFSDVSPTCQATLLKAAAVSKACSADVKKMCADVKPGGGRIEACMKSHLSEVSDPCKDAMSQATAGKS